MVKTNKGFTLIELLVVIAIIGLLSSVVLASLNSARTKARDARRVADIKQMQTALELYYDTNKRYPATASVATDLAPTYIASYPVDPSSTARAYAYAADTNGTTYCIAADMEGTPPAGGPSSCPSGASATSVGTGMTADYWARP